MTPDRELVRVAQAVGADVAIGAEQLHEIEVGQRRVEHRQVVLVAERHVQVQQPRLERLQPLAARARRRARSTRPASRLRIGAVRDGVIVDSRRDVVERVARCSASAASAARNAPRRSIRQPSAGSASTRSPSGPGSRAKFAASARNPAREAARQVAPAPIRADLRQRSCRARRASGSSSVDHLVILRAADQASSGRVSCRSSALRLRNVTLVPSNPTPKSSK